MITIDPEIFGYNPATTHFQERFVVTGDLDAGSTYAILAALARAADRFMLVDETGFEHRDNASAEAAIEEEGLFGPNYVSEATVTLRGVEMYVDCKGEIPEEMGQTLRHVLREELEHMAVDVRVSAPTRS